MTDDYFPIAHVIGPHGDVLTEADLPPRNTARWVPRRKAEVIAAVNGGLLSLADACQRYRISHEEYRDWVRAYEQSGLSGLRARRGRNQPKTETQPENTAGTVMPQALAPDTAA